MNPIEYFYQALLDKVKDELETDNELLRADIKIECYTEAVKLIAELAMIRHEEE